MPNTSPRHRRFQFTLKMPLIGIALFGTAFGWFAFEIRKAESQRSAVNAIRAAGGDVMYDETSESRRRVIAPWLRARLGDDFLARVIFVRFGDPTEIDGSLLDSLSSLTNLKSLDLSATTITDAKLGKLSRLGHLEYLDLSATGITDVGLRRLVGMTDLKRLNLLGTDVSDSGLRNLQCLTELQWLDLQATEITDAGLPYLKSLSNLEYLGLQSTSVTDSGLEHLKLLAGLRELELFYTGVTEEGVEELRHALPECEIFWVPRTSK